MMGLPVSTALLWWYWPEAHGFVLNPLGIFLIGTATLCDVVYPFVLRHVRLSEKVLPDGRIVAGAGIGEGAEEKKRQ